jgi:CcmD family protein
VIRASYVHYVAAVYGVVWVIVLAYVAILNSKLGRLERQIDELTELLAARGHEEPAREPELALPELVERRGADA